MIHCRSLALYGKVVLVLAEKADSLPVSLLLKMGTMFEVSFMAINVPVLSAP